MEAPPLETPPLKLIDNHVHGAVTRDLDFAGFESQLTEGHGTQMFDTQLGFAIRRWCAPVLDLEPSAPAPEYVRRALSLAWTRSIGGC